MDVFLKHGVYSWCVTTVCNREISERKCVKEPVNREGEGLSGRAIVLGERALSGEHLSLGGGAFIRTSDITLLESTGTKLHVVTITSEGSSSTSGVKIPSTNWTLSRSRLFPSYNHYVIILHCCTVAAVCRLRVDEYRWLECAVQHETNRSV